MLSFLYNFLYSQFLVTPPYPEHSYAGQTVIVTGANIGLGFEAARHFVRLGAKRVILAVRTLEKGEQAKKDVEESTNRLNVVEVWKLDLSSFQSVKDFAARAQKLDRIDVLLENAGIVTTKWVVTEGHESTITTNVISTFLLALLLLPKLRETAVKFAVHPRLTIVSSEMHFVARFNECKSEAIFEQLKDPKDVNMNDRYSVSKLIEVFVVRELAALMESTNKNGTVILNTLNPGLCYSNILHESEGIARQFMNIFRAVAARTTEVGSRTLVAAAHAGEESHGQYMTDGHVAPVSDFVTSDEGAKVHKRVWSELSQILEGIQPGILKNI